MTDWQGRRVGGWCWRGVRAKTLGVLNVEGAQSFGVARTPDFWDSDSPQVCPCPCLCASRPATTSAQSIVVQVGCCNFQNRSISVLTGVAEWLLRPGASPPSSNRQGFASPRRCGPLCSAIESNAFSRVLLETRETSLRRYCADTSTQRRP